MFKKLRRTLFGMLSPAEEKILSTDGLENTSKQKLKANDYNPKLIPVFEKEHRVLLALYKRIHTSAVSGKAADVRADLKKFRLLLTGHLLKENQHLYTYLIRELDDDVSVEMVLNMKKEMDDIGKVVLGFISQYSKTDAKIDSSFVEGLEEIGTALVERIQNEEQHLYPNYMPAA